MCRAFLDRARGTLQGDVFQVVCADEMVQDILQDRAVDVLRSVTGEAAGHPVTVAFSVGQVPPAAARDSLDTLIGLGGQLDHFTIKGE